MAARPGRRHETSRGFTMIEMMMVVAILGILVSIAIPLFNNVTARSRVSKAQADVKTLATAVSAYAAHVGDLPPDLAALTVTVANSAGIVMGPFMAAAPAPPTTAWVPYTYVAGPAGTFTVSGTGEGTTVSAP